MITAALAYVGFTLATCAEVGAPPQAVPPEDLVEADLLSHFDDGRPTLWVDLMFTTFTAEGDGRADSDEVYDVSLGLDGGPSGYEQTTAGLAVDASRTVSVSESEYDRGRSSMPLAPGEYALLVELSPNAEEPDQFNDDFTVRTRLLVSPRFNMP